MSKGDWVRPMDKKKFDEGYERVFGEHKLKLWNPDEDDEIEPSEPKIVRTDSNGFEYDENGGVHYPVDISLRRKLRDS